MKNIVLCLSIFSVLFTGCQGRPRTHKQPSRQTLSPNDAVHGDLTAEQQILVEKYERFRLKVALGLGVKETASWEEIMRAFAKAAKLPADTGWKRLLKEPMVQDALTEEKRKAFVRGFNLQKDADWLAIKEAVEKVKASQ